MARSLTLALYCPVQAGSRILRDGHLVPAIGHKLYATSPVKLIADG